MSVDAEKSLQSERWQHTVQGGLLEAANNTPQKIAVVVNGQSYSYSHLLDESLKLAHALKNRGVRPGDRVAIYMDNTWPCIVSLFGVLLAGAVFVFINPQVKVQKLAFTLNDSAAKVLMTDVHLEASYSAAFAFTDTAVRVIASGECFPQSSSTVAIEPFNEVIGSITCLDALEPVEASDLVTLVYTADVSGTPKAVMHTHASMLASIRCMIQCQMLTSKDRIMLVLPLAFDSGFYQLLMSVKLGAMLVVERSFTFPANVYQRILSESITVFPVVPTILALMVMSYRKKALCFPSINTVTDITGTLNSEWLTELRNLFPNAGINKMMGMAECRWIAWLEPHMWQLKQKSVGKPVPGVEVALLPMDGKPASTGGEGLLQVQSSQMMSGYWKREKLTREVLRPQGMAMAQAFCANDMYRMDSDGYLYFLGHSYELIDTRGEKVSPVEIESVLHEIEGIAEATVIGVTDAVLGHAIRAFVVVDDSERMNGKFIRKACMARLENYMVPRDIVIVKTLPRLPDGKIDRQALSGSMSPDKNMQ